MCYRFLALVTAPPYLDLIPFTSDNTLLLFEITEFLEPFLMLTLCLVFFCGFLFFFFFGVKLDSPG
jgi:hypothetical protein